MREAIMIAILAIVSCMVLYQFILNIIIVFEDKDNKKHK